MTNQSLIKQNISKRSKGFLPNPKLDELISQLKDRLEPLQKEQNKKFSAPEKPVILVFGSPRSGTTLLTQILSSTGDFAYPSNFLTRFAFAPYFGAMFQQMLFNPEYDFGEEMSDIQSNSNFQSNLGKTKGALGVNEFFHFWRKFFPNYEPGFLTNNDLLNVDIIRMRSELAGIESVFGKPFVSKGKMMQFNSSFFSQRMPELFFIHIKRDPLFVMQSVLLSRRKYYNTDRIWFSVKPKEYSWLSKLDVFKQIAGQIFFTERAIEEELGHIASHRKLTIHYENLCEDPLNFYDKLGLALKRNNHSLSSCNLPEFFPSGNSLKVTNKEFNKLKTAYEKFSDH